MASSARSHTILQRPTGRLPSLSSTRSRWAGSCGGSEAIQQRSHSWLRSLQIRVADEELVGRGGARGGEAHHDNVEQKQHRLFEEGAHGLDALAGRRAGLRDRLGRRGVHANDDLGELSQGRGGDDGDDRQYPAQRLGLPGHRAQAVGLARTGADHEEIAGRKGGSRDVAHHVHVKAEVHEAHGKGPYHEARAAGPGHEDAPRGAEPLLQRPELARVHRPQRVAQLVQHPFQVTRAHGRSSPRARRSAVAAARGSAARAIAEPTTTRSGRRAATAGAVAAVIPPATAVPALRSTAFSRRSPSTALRSASASPRWTSTGVCRHTQRTPSRSTSAARPARSDTPIRSTITSPPRSCPARTASRMVSSAAAASTVTIRAPASKPSVASKWPPSAILRSATRVRSGKTARRRRTAPTPSLINSGVPTSTRSTRSRTRETSASASDTVRVSMASCNRICAQTRLARTNFK